MKIRLLNAGLCVCVLLMTLSGCSSDETLTDASKASTKSMKVNVSDGMFSSVDDNGAKTRATDNGTATTFSSGDAIGIFAVKPDGTVVLTNAKYTYDGTSKWLNSDNTDNLPYYEGAKYFAYYPYQENMDGKYLASVTFSNLTTESFFSTLISGWAPASDQSTQAKYTAQDLMMSMATVNTSTYSISFAMSHQMSMVEMDFHQAHYTYNGADKYRFTFDAANKPFNIADGKYRFLVNPSTILSITGNNQYNSTDVTQTKGWKITGTSPAVAKYKVYKYNGASACLTETQRQNACIGDANIGDYLYADGTTGVTFKSGQIVGIIFSNELTESQYKAGCRHGKVIALKNANNSNSCYWANAYNSPYTDHSSTGHLYSTTLKTCFDDVSSGYDALSANSSYVGNSGNYAWYYCRNYSDEATKSFTNSGWYLPSAGEWWDAMENLGTFTDSQKIAIKSMRTNITGLGAYIIQGLSYNYFSNLNAKLAEAGGNAIVPSSGTYFFWSASEYYNNCAIGVYFNSNFVYENSLVKTSSRYCVRAILAY
jgi:hypothetical protein